MPTRDIGVPGSARSDVPAAPLAARARAVCRPEPVVRPGMNGRRPPDQPRRHGFGPVVLLRWAMSLCLLAEVAAAQAAPPPRPIRTLLGDVALILRAEGPRSLRIAVAGPSRTLSLLVLNSDARRWADSAAALLAPQRPPSAKAKRTARDGVQRSRAILEEPGVGAGSFMLTRVDSAGVRRFLLFADDSALMGIRQPLAVEEARLLVRLVRRAATPAPPRRHPSRKGAPGTGEAASVPARP